MISSLPSWPHDAAGLVGRMLGCLAVHVGWIVAAGVVAGVLWGAGYIFWRRRAAAALRDRVAFELMPAVGFDPAPSEVAWFAGQVGAVRAACGPVPQRAVATRVRLVHVDGKMRYQLEGPARAASVLQMPGFEQVEVVTAGAGAGGPHVPRIHFEGAAPLTESQRGTSGGA
ncbi:hypothetical protein ACWGCW_28070 [Streptomyces sp. NPDC054933]